MLSNITAKIIGLTLIWWVLSTPHNCIFVSTMDTARVFVPILIPRSPCCYCHWRFQLHPPWGWTEGSYAGHQLLASFSANSIFSLFPRHVTCHYVLTDLFWGNFSFPAPPPRHEETQMAELGIHELYPKLQLITLDPFGLKWWVLPTQLSFTVESELV